MQEEDRATRAIEKINHVPNLLKKSGDPKGVLRTAMSGIHIF
jgi:hypothetical protein